MYRAVKIALHWLLLLTLAASLVGCNLVKMTPEAEPLPAVAPLPIPELPDWIEQISPTGEAEPTAQIRIRFQEPLIPLESLDSPAQKELLQQFAIVPPLPGRFRFLTPRMVGFQADRALPKATRIQVTLKAGLADLANHSLAEDLAWTFNTEPVRLNNLPGTPNRERTNIAPVGIEPTWQVSSNVELDVKSLETSANLIATGTETAVKLKVLPVASEIDSSYTSPQQQFNPDDRNWQYALTLQQRLAKATRYRLEFAPGLRPVRGNLPSEKPFISYLDTYAPLALEQLNFYGQPDAGGAYGRFVQGSPQLQFNNGLNAESALANIKLQPAPQKSNFLRIYEGSPIVEFNPWALEPATNYTITIGSKLQDKFGQTLGKAATRKFNTGDVVGDIWAPTGLKIFPASQNLQLNITAVNLPQSEYKATYQVVNPTDLVYNGNAYPSENGRSLLPATSTWSSFSFRGQKNKTTQIAIPLGEKLAGNTGMLAYGVQAKTNRYQYDNRQYWREPVYSGLVQLTNLGVFAQWFPDSGLVRVHHLDDGSPVKNSTVEVYRSKLGAKSRPRPQACAIASTDSTGTLLIEGQAWRNCLRGQDFRYGNGPQLLVIAKEGKDWAFTRTYGYSGAYGYGMSTNWDDGQPRSRGTIFSDRQLYQPGETAYFTAAAYYLQKGILKQDKNTAYRVTLQNPDGKKQDLGTHTTNKFGTFSLELPWEKERAIGYYSLVATAKNGVKINGGFRVAEFNPPNFKVELNLDKKIATIGSEIQAKVASNYLFGAPVQGGKAKYYVTRRRTYFNPPGWSKFDFGRQWFWPEESPQLASNVLQSEQVLDEAGTSQQIVKVAKDVPYPMRYRVDAEISDVSNLSVANSASFIALPSNRLIGLKTNWVADAKQPFPVEIIVTDSGGESSHWGKSQNRITRD